MTYQESDHQLVPMIPQSVTDRWRCTCGADLGRPTSGAIGALSNLERHRDAQQASVQADRLADAFGVDDPWTVLIDSQSEPETVTVPAPILSQLLHAYERWEG